MQNAGREVTRQAAQAFLTYAEKFASWKGDIRSTLGFVILVRRHWSKPGRDHRQLSTPPFLAESIRGF